ncbi:MAG: cell division protein ZapB [Treponema sp.]|nr:cell division protein ZapB [Treponema sp.]
MVTLEQIKLLESKLTRAINFVTQLTEEKNSLKKRNKELEETIISLKEEKTRWGEGIESALGILNRFEDAIERSLETAVSAGSAGSASSVKSSPKPLQEESITKVKTASEQPIRRTESPRPEKLIPPEKARPVVPSAYTIDEEAEPVGQTDPVDPFEENAEPADSMDLSEDLDDTEDSGEAELDIF